MMLDAPSLVKESKWSQKDRQGKTRGFGSTGHDWPLRVEAETADDSGRQDLVNLVQ